MLQVIDVATPQKALNLQAPFNAGWRDIYVKLGGDNNPRYKSPYYNNQVDQARTVGYHHIGHYWVPDDSQDPVGAARWFVQNLRNWNRATDFIVLDNESFPDNDPDGSGPQTRSDRYSDSQAAAWVNEVKRLLNIPGRQVKVYYGLADARTTNHTNVLATGAQFIIAAYSYSPFTFPAPSNIPMSRIDGHQYGGLTFDGIATDVNMFRDEAFNYNNNKDEEMRVFANIATNLWALGGPGVWYPIPPALASKFQEIYGTRIALTDAEFIAFRDAMKSGASGAIDTDAIVAAVVEGVRAELTDLPVSVDEASIASRVRSAFAADPLK